MPRICKAAGRAAKAAATRLRLGQPLPQATPEVVHLQRRRYEPVTSDLPPATWRNASDWVDLELLRAGLPAQAAREAGSTRIPSRWGDDDLQPEPSVLWPNSALDDHRSRAFVLPRQQGAKEESQKDSAEDEKVEKEKVEKELRDQLDQNKKRLEALWAMSNSHGISWDELDTAFVAFAKEGKRRYAHWSQAAKIEGAEPDDQQKQDSGASPAPLKHEEPTAALMKRYCEARARAFLQPFCPKDETTGRRVDPRQVWRSHLRRLTSRLYRKEKKKFLAPWAPGKLTAKLQQLVAARMIRRETNERLYGLVSLPGQVRPCKFEPSPIEISR